MKPQILIVDDEDLFREDLASLLREEGYECRTAATGEEGLAIAHQGEPDLVLCDLSMPGLGGVEVVDDLAIEQPDLPVVLMTAYGSLDTAIEAFRKGAADYLLKPLQDEELLVKLTRCLEQRFMLRELRFLRRRLSHVDEGTRLVGSSPQMERVKELIRRVATAQTTVLVTGETGTGKEVVARSIHEQGAGPEAPFVAVNCAALPRELVESELFGHRKGAFSGALRDKPGMFELAHGGTLFLDEIGDLPLELQPKLLRALERGEIMPVGATRPIVTHFRLIAATHRDLPKEAEAGRFREDLFYRIRVMEITLPPLRERRSDIPALVDHLLPRINSRLKKRVLGVNDQALRALMSGDWPGNVRELENALERAVLLTDETIVGRGVLPGQPTDLKDTHQHAMDLRSAVQAYEEEHIRRVLESTGGNREEAAEILGIDPSTLYRRLQRFDTD